MFGRIIFLLIFIFSGILANLGTFAFENAPISLGASGAICGLYGAYTYYYWVNRQRLGELSQSALLLVKRTILLNVAQAYFGTEKDIDHYAHAYGYIAGIGITAIAVALRDLKRSFLLPKI
eukprot:gene2994-3178_t